MDALCGLLCGLSQIFQQSPLDGTALSAPSSLYHLTLFISLSGASFFTVYVDSSAIGQSTFISGHYDECHHAIGPGAALISYSVTQ
jgi:hypothetical protein